MIRLHQYPGVWGLTSLSPFCIKVEFMLKAANLPYEVVVETNPARGPKGKMPFIVDAGKTIPDSSFILDHLFEKYELTHLDINDPSEKASANTIKYMIEESLYFVLLYSRWVDPDGYKFIKEEFKPFFPKYVGTAIVPLIRRSLLKQAKAQGLGRHSKEEVYEIGKKQIETLSTLLGDKNYFFEDRLTYIDATAFSFLATIYFQPFHSPLREQIKHSENLVAYVKRLNSDLMLNQCTGLAL